MVERLQREYNVQVDWRPYYLRPDTPPEGMELPEYIKKAHAGGSEERLRAIADLYGMTYRTLNRIYNTRLAHEATEYARRKEKANEFHHVVFRKVYAEGQDPAQWATLRAAAEEVGLDAGDMQSVVESGTYTAEVAEQVQQAQVIGVSGVPTYVINDQYAIVGAQPYEAFQSALTQIMKKQ